MTWHWAKNVHDLALVNDEINVKVMVKGLSSRGNENKEKIMIKQKSSSAGLLATKLIELAEAN
ncbi:hypothetical protein [Photobacterium sp. TY1-4]|uniref:hypothetical protein n=1 Tax=Photobacterium sp. TY1-4 TaxID=2899122 RepID=UPI0021C226BB|nr:hypothetical protein [Photobacterium sp. TY1-4]UXI03730.1 hypothetical protein NH461_16515 [Photobacterium sp. TY1-4]